MTTTPTTKTLSAYLDGELGAEEKAAVEKALHESPALRDELEQLRALDTLLGDTSRGLMKEPLPIDLVSSVHQRVFEERPGKTEAGRSISPLRPWLRLRAPVAAAAIIAALLAFPTGYYLSSVQNEQYLAELRRQIESDRLAFAQFVAEALERRLSGETAAWQNAHSGSSGTVTPVRTFRNVNGQWCREYREEVNLAEERHVRSAIACRSSEGQWRTRVIAVEQG